MFKYYKNLFTYVSKISWNETWWTNFPTEKQTLIDTVNSLNLSPEQLTNIKLKIEAVTRKKIQNFTIDVWRKLEIDRINSTNNPDGLKSFREKYTRFQEEIKQESRDDRGNLSGSIENPKVTEAGFKTPEEMIANLTAGTEKKYNESANVAIFPNSTPTILQSAEEKDTSATKKPETASNNATSIKDISVTLDKDYSRWVKENLKKDWYYKNFENPTKDEIIWVLNKFKDTRFEWKEWPQWWTSAIFAIQWALQLLWNTIKVDWVYWNETKSIIREFQTNNKLKPDWIPGPKTITALLSSIEK